VSRPSTTIFPLWGREHLEQRGRLAATGLPDEPERLALADVEGDPVDGAHGAHLALDDGALDERMVLDEGVRAQDDGALLPRTPPGRGRRERGGREHLGGGEAAGLELVRAVARGEPAGRPDGRQGGLEPAADVDRDRAPGREGAPRRQPDGRRRRALDRHERRPAGPVDPGDGAQEPDGVGHARPVVDVVDRADLHHAAGVHDRHPVGEPGDDAEVVRDEDDRRAGDLARGPQHFEHLRLDGHVERGGGLVGQDHVGVVRDCHGDHDALAHAARELVREGARALARARDAHEV
jgi:hypothetical protein